MTRRRRRKRKGWKEGKRVKRRWGVYVCVWFGWFVIRIGRIMKMVWEVWQQKEYDLK